MRTVRCSSHLLGGGGCLPNGYVCSGDVHHLHPLRTEFLIRAYVLITFPQLRLRTVKDRKIEWPSCQKCDRFFTHTSSRFGLRFRLQIQWLCRTFHTAQSQIQIPVPTTNYRNGIRFRSQRPTTGMGSDSGPNDQLQEWDQIPVPTTNYRNGIRFRSQRPTTGMGSDSGPNDQLQEWDQIPVPTTNYRNGIRFRSQRPTTGMGSDSGPNDQLQEWDQIPVPTTNYRNGIRFRSQRPTTGMGSDSGPNDQLQEWDQIPVRAQVRLP